MIDLIVGIIAVGWFIGTFIIGRFLDDVLSDDFDDDGLSLVIIFWPIYGVYKYFKWIYLKVKEVKEL